MCVWVGGGGGAMMRGWHAGRWLLQIMGLATRLQGHRGGKERGELLAEGEHRTREGLIRPDG